MGALVDQALVQSKEQAHLNAFLETFDTSAREQAERVTSV